MTNIITTASIIADPTTFNPEGQFIFDEGNWFSNSIRRSNLQQSGKDGLIEASMEQVLVHAVTKYRKGKWDRDQAIAYVTKAHKSTTTGAGKAIMAVCAVLVLATPVLIRVPRIIMTQQNNAPAVQYVAPAADYAN